MNWGRGGRAAESPLPTARRGSRAGPRRRAPPCRAAASRVPPSSGAAPRPLPPGALPAPIPFLVPVAPPRYRPPRRARAADAAAAILSPPAPAVPSTPPPRSAPRAAPARAPIGHAVGPVPERSNADWPRLHHVGFRLVRYERPSHLPRPAAGLYDRLTGLSVSSMGGV